MSTTEVTIPMHKTHTMMNLYIGLMFYIEILRSNQSHRSEKNSILS
jgi:hypothetical protein